MEVRQTEAHKEPSDHFETSNTQHGCDYDMILSVRFHQILTGVKSPEKLTSYASRRSRQKQLSVANRDLKK